jgi:hypothetical protein
LVNFYQTTRCYKSEDSHLHRKYSDWLNCLNREDIATRLFGFAERCVCKHHFVTFFFFGVRLFAPDQPSSWRTTPCVMFDIFAATFHNANTSPLTHHAVVTHVTWAFLERR